MAEEGASIPDIDDRLAKMDSRSHRNQIQKIKRKKKSKGKKNPRRQRKKQPIDSRLRGSEEVEDVGTKTTVHIQLVVVKAF